MTIMSGIPDSQLDLFALNVRHVRFWGALRSPDICSCVIYLVSLLRFVEEKPTNTNASAYPVAPRPYTKLWEIAVCERACPWLRRGSNRKMFMGPLSFACYRLGSEHNKKGQPSPKTREVGTATAAMVVFLRA